MQTKILSCKRKSYHAKENLIMQTKILSCKRNSYHANENLITWPDAKDRKTDHMLARITGPVGPCKGPDGARPWVSERGAALWSVAAAHQPGHGSYGSGLRRHA